MSRPDNIVIADFRPKTDDSVVLPVLPPQNWSYSSYLLCNIMHRDWKRVGMTDGTIGAHCNCCNRTYWWNEPAKTSAEQVRRMGNAVARQFTKGMVP